MAQVKEQNPAQAQNNPNRNSESGGEKRTRTRRPYYNRRPRRAQQPKEAAVPITSTRWAVWAKWART